LIRSTPGGGGEIFPNVDACVYLELFVVWKGVDVLEMLRNTINSDKDNLIDAKIQDTTDYFKDTKQYGAKKTTAVHYFHLE
jgi:hypothetical protein